MEGQKDRDLTGTHIHRFYFVRLLPSPLKVLKQEFEKQYHSMNRERIRINEELAQQKADEHRINKKLWWFSHLDQLIEWKMTEINNLEHWGLGKVKRSLPIKSAPRTTGFFCLTGKDAQSSVRPDRKRFQKRLIKKGSVDIEYLQQVQEEQMSLPNSNRTLCDTQELNDMIESMVQRITHGKKKLVDEAKMYQEISKFKGINAILIAREPDPQSYQWHRREPNSKRHVDQIRSTQHRINILLKDIEYIKTLQIGRSARVRRLKAELEHVKKNISHLNKKLINVTSKCLEAYERANPPRDQNKQLNSSYNGYQAFKTCVRALARKGDVVELEILCNTQVEGFMRQWNDSKAFRKEYENKKNPCG